MGPLEQSPYIRIYSYLIQDTDTDDTDNGSDDEDAEDQALPNFAAELEAAVAAMPVSHSTSPPPQDSPPPKRKFPPLSIGHLD